MNPAVDYVASVDSLRVGVVNRAEATRWVRGGKGTNVARALTRLGVDCVEIPVAVKPRVNVKIHHDGGVTEVNGSCAISESAVAAVREYVANLTVDDLLIIGGSLPCGVESGFYAELVGSTAAVTIVDTSGEALRHVAEQGLAWLIAPNESEWQELGGVGESSRCNTLVTLGERGAELRVGGERYFCKPEKVAECGYTVGAGDTLLAGFVAQWVKSHDYEKSLIAGVKLAGEFVCKLGCRG